MRILENWQYKYIEKCLFNYKQLLNSTLETEKKMVLAINEALTYFKGQPHEIMMTEFYFNRHKYTKRYTVTGHFRHVCMNLLYMEEPNGYVVRREIVYRIAMICFELHIFRSKINKIEC